MTNLQSSLAQINKRVENYREDREEVWRELVKKKLISNVRQYAETLDVVINKASDLHLKSINDNL